MKKIIFRIYTFIQHLYLKRKGYRFKPNTIISYKGVRKIGPGKINCGCNVNINAEVMFVAYKDITIGDNSTIAYRTTICTSANPNAPYNKLCKIYKPKHESVSIGKDCWIGCGAIILPGVTIGNGSVIAEGAVVCTDVPDNVMVAGCPATIKKHLHLLADV